MESNTTETQVTSPSAGLFEDPEKWAEQNKSGIIIGTLVAILVGAGIVVLGQNAQKSADKETAKAFLFQKEFLKTDPPVAPGQKKEKTEKKPEPKAVKEAFIQLLSEITGSNASIPVVLTALEGLQKEKQIDAGVVEALDSYTSSVKGGEGRYLLQLQLAALQENVGDKEGAIASLNDLLGQGAPYLKGKVYLDLGRLYLGNSQSEKARQSFEFILKEEKEFDAEVVKLAKLYLNSRF